VLKMAKISKKKFDEYKAVNENGFKVNLGSILHQFAFGDEYPKLYIIVKETDTLLLTIDITFFKYHGGESEHKIEGIEREKSTNMLIGGTGYFKKNYFVERNKKGQRFSFKYLKELCYQFNIEELKREVLHDYEEKKNVEKVYSRRSVERWITNTKK
jgi:hypothetical protein